MDLSTVTVAQFKARFYRDFYFANMNPDQGQSPPPEGIEAIQDADIENAFADAQVLLNQALFPCNNVPAITQGYLYLTAHCLSLNIKTADAGVNSSGTGGFPVASRSVGSVSETYDIPEAYKNSPVLAQYAQTGYGQKYLAMVLPYIVGNVVAVCGGAQPGWD